MLLSRVIFGLSDQRSWVSKGERRSQAGILFVHGRGFIEHFVFVFFKHGPALGLAWAVATAVAVRSSDLGELWHRLLSTRAMTRESRLCHFLATITNV